MKKMKKTVLMGASALLLTACSGAYDLDAVRNMKPKGGQFLQGLHAQYVELAASEAAESDWDDASVFNGRAMMAANGKGFGPENINDRVIPGDKVAILSSARARLMRVLDNGGADRSPRTAARAQAMFDCWMQEQEENFQPEDIARCRAAFDIAMKQLESRTVAMPAPMKPMAAPNKGPFVILFDFNKSEMNASANVVVAQIVMEALNQNPSSLVVSGHADRAGGNDYNAKLANMRAGAVAKALKGTGITTRIVVESHGEGRPMVKTSDGQRQKLNRRVEVMIR